MANLDFCDKYNMVAYLQKSEGSEGFHQIIDFLTTSHIRYALTESPTIYVSLIEQFWQTASASTLENGNIEITTTIYGKVKVASEASIRRHIKLEDFDGISTLPTSKFFEQLALISDMKRGFSGKHTPLFQSMLVIQAAKGEGSRHPSEPQPPPSTAQPTNKEPIPTVVSSSHQKTQTPRQVLKEVTELPQTSEPISNVPDKAVYEEWDDRVGRVTTTVASLDAIQASGGSPRCQEAMGGSIAQTRSEKVKKLEQTVKTSQARRRAKIIVSDDEKDSEDSSKQGRKINEIDQDPDITLVQHDVEIQGRYGQEMEFETKVYTTKDVSTAGASVTTAGASISTASPPRVSTAKIISVLLLTLCIIGGEQPNTQVKATRKGMNVEALQTKYLIIDWEVYTKDSRMYWKIIRVGRVEEVVLNLMLSDDYGKSQKQVHDIQRDLYIHWKCNHVSTKDGIDIYMLVEKEYPFSRGVLTQMLVAKLLVEQNNEMSRELLRKIFMMAKRPRR
ncbi:hypothetical protein Tco_1448036 [Tanacetum coccineum]